MVASFGGRLFAAVARLTPYYLPDEYIYPSLARSLAESGRPLIRGAGVHFPALLDPIVTAPVWLVTNDPVAAFRLTQGIHAVLFSLAAIPAYLLCRRLGLSSWPGIAVAALTVAVPDGVYSSTMLADPLAYPLVLSAVYAGVCVVSEPTLRAQLAFAVISALGVFARIQYVIVPLAVVLAEVVVDRFHVVRAVRRLWLSLVLLIVPPVLLLATLGSARVFGVYANGDHAVHLGSILHWVGLEAMLLTYSTGWVIVPGALAGLAIALCLYVKRGLPGRIPVGLLSAGLLLLAARVPLSGYAAAHNKDDSPTLWAVLRFEGLTSVGNGSLAIALIAALLSVLGALVAFRKVPAALALVAAVVACSAMSAGASAFDARTSRSLHSTLPHDIRWVDHARLGNVDLLAPPGSLKEQSWQQLFWNTSVKRLLLLGSAPIDQFDAKTVRVAGDGTLLVDGRPSRRPLLVQTYSSTVELSGVRRVRHELVFDLYRAVGTPRLRVLAAGRFADRWLAPKGAITVWTKTGGTLELVLALPADTQVTPIDLTGIGIKRTVRVHPGERIALSFPVP